MAGEQDPIADVLKAVPTSDRVRAAAWDAFYQAKDRDDLTSRLKDVPIPDEVKAALWDAKPEMNFATVKDTPSLVDRAVDLLPAAGGMAGGVAGGVGGTVLGMGVGGVPGAIGGATLGGGFGEAVKQLVNRLRGKEAPASASDAMLSIGKAGAVQGGMEAAGGVVGGAAKMAGRALLENAVRPTASLLREFPNVMQVIERARLPVGRGPFGGASGAARAGQLRGASARGLRALLAKAEQAGTRFSNNDVAAPVLDLIDQIAKQPLGDAEDHHLAGMIDEFLRRHPGPLTPNAVKDLKQSAQAIAAPIYRAQAAGHVVPAGETLKGRFNEAIASGSKRALATIPGVPEAEATTQGFIGASRAIRQAEGRRLPLSAEALSVAAPMIQTMLKPGGSLPDEVRRGVVSYLTTRGLMSPRSSSRIGLTLTAKETGQLLRQFPRLSEAVVTQLQAEGAGASK